MIIDKDKIIVEDGRSLQLTHYVVAERLAQVEADCIAQEVRTDGTSDTLIHILTGGFRGFHNMLDEDLRREWKDSEDHWYRLYETGELPWSIYEDDPVVALEEDENGEVEHA